MATKATYVPLVAKAVHIQPKTLNQSYLLDAIEQADMVIATGPAGTGKTYISVNAAVNLLAKGEVKRIVMTRPNVSTGRSLGFFPGSIQEKLEPWLAPMISVLKKRLGPNDYQAKVHNGTIAIYPLETIRGASFEDTIILIDESQNLNYEEIKAMSTRLGEGSKMVFMGDPAQRDTRDSGLVEFEKIIARYSLPIPVVKFTVDDIVRSDLVGKLVRAFMSHEGH
jgi:phosphate starvation-inducible PhoH-like protein